MCSDEVLSGQAFPFLTSHRLVHANSSWLLIGSSSVWG